MAQDFRFPGLIAEAMHLVQTRTLPPEPPIEKHN